MPKLSVIATTKTELDLKIQTKTRLVKELKAYAALSEQMKSLKEAMRVHSASVEDILIEVGESSVGVDGYKATLVSPVKRKLEVKKLIALGVSQDVITRATSEKPGKSYVRITAPGAAEEGEYVDD